MNLYDDVIYASQLSCGVASRCPKPVNKSGVSNYQLPTINLEPLGTDENDRLCVTTTQHRLDPVNLTTEKTHVILSLDYCVRTYDV